MNTAICLLLLIVLPAAAQSCKASVGEWVPHHVTIHAAARMDYSHLGVHTHANALVFDTGALDIGQMQSDGTRFRSVRVVGHCRLPTERAALPPGFDALLKDYGPVPAYGPIDGSPGWSSHPFHANGHNGVKFVVPTRFANWVAGQPPALRHRYKSLHSYSLDIAWEERAGG